MRWLICALGVVLAICGVAAIVLGYPYIRMEFGWTEVIAGTTALSGGVVTFALGAVLFALRTLGQGFAVAATGAPFESARVTVQNVALDPVEEIDRPRHDDIPPESAVPTETQDTRRTRPRADPVPVLAPTISVDSPPDREAASPRPTLAEVAESPPRAPRAAPSVPTVLGRYEAGGASYVLFSDGTIEVESEGGTQRFESMQHLRAHIGTEQGTG